LDGKIKPAALATLRARFHQNILKRENGLLLATTANATEMTWPDAGGSDEGGVLGGSSKIFDQLAVQPNTY
jgi:hypothetical protein